MTNSLRELLALGALLILSLALAAPAANAQSSRDGYIEPGPAITLDRGGGGGGGGGEAAPQADSGGALPFTGLDVGLIGIAGASLLVLGFGMRRLTRAPDAA